MIPSNCTYNFDLKMSIEYPRCDVVECYWHGNEDRLNEGGASYECTYIVNINTQVKSWTNFSEDIPPYEVAMCTVCSENSYAININCEMCGKLMFDKWITNEHFDIDVCRDCIDNDNLAENLDDDELYEQLEKYCHDSEYIQAILYNNFPSKYFQLLYIPVKQ